MVFKNNNLKIALFCLAIVFAFSCGGDDDDNDDNETATDDDAVDDDDAAPDDDNDASPAGDDDDDDDDDEYPNDGALLLNEIQMLGSHNSYHVYGQALPIPFFNYTLPPLEEQLDLGVRQFELDIHYNHGNGLTVYHVPLFDAGTTCEYFTDCLRTLKTWSDNHPGHQPLFLFIEPKDDLDQDKLAGHDPELEAEILSVWPRERIIAPDDVRKDYANLREAIVTEGWPTLGESRNKILFICFDEGDFRDRYVETDPLLEGRLLFPRGDLDGSWGCFDNYDDPREDAARIDQAVADGFLIRTRADENCLEALADNTDRQTAALATGAHFISTDFPVPHPQTGYVFTIPGGNPSICNPLIAPDFCVPEDIENL